jgi:hypothetical protein
MDELLRFYRRALQPRGNQLDIATPARNPTLPLDITARSPLPNAVGVTQAPCR